MVDGKEKEISDFSQLFNFIVIHLRVCFFIKKIDDKTRKNLMK